MPRDSAWTVTCDHALAHLRRHERDANVVDKLPQPAFKPGERIKERNTEPIEQHMLTVGH